MMVKEAISHEKVRDEMDKYIAKMKATGFRQCIEPKKVLKEIGEEE